MLPVGGPVPCIFTATLTIFGIFISKVLFCVLVCIKGDFECGVNHTAVGGAEHIVRECVQHLRKPQRNCSIAAQVPCHLHFRFSSL
jgi:hypothetical protein